MWVVVTGGVVIFFALAALPTWTRARFKYWPKWGDSAEAGWYAALGTFGGVFLALFAGSCHERSSTITNLDQTIGVARSEIQRSLQILNATSELVAAADGSGDKLVANNPATTLNVLVNSSKFLELAEPNLASDLVTLNTGLRWKDPIVSGFAAGGGGRGPHYPNPKIQYPQLKLADELLKLQSLNFSDCYDVDSDRLQAWKKYRQAIDQ